MKFAAVIFASLLVAAIASAQEAEKTDAAKAGTKTENSAKESKKDDKKPGAKKDQKKDEKKKEEKKDTSRNDETVPKEVKKLITHELSVGNGKIAGRGKKIKVNYTGWLYDPAKPMGRGQQFDSSVGKEPFTFTLGSGEVIKGWDDGFENMKVGGKRKLIIPSEMGYGASGAGNVIPPNAPLMFEVELVDVL